MSWASDAVDAIAKRGRIDEPNLVDALVTLGFDESWVDAGSGDRSMGNVHLIVGDELVDLIDTAAWLSVSRRDCRDVAACVENMQVVRREGIDLAMWPGTTKHHLAEHRELVADAWRAIGRRSARPPGRDLEAEDALIGQLEQLERENAALRKLLELCPACRPLHESPCVCAMQRAIVAIGPHGEAVEIDIPVSQGSCPQHGYDNSMLGGQASFSVGFTHG